MRLFQIAGKVRGLGFSADGRSLAVAAEERPRVGNTTWVVSRWDLAEGVPCGAVSARSPIAVAPDHSRLAHPVLHRELPGVRLRVVRLAGGNERVLELEPLNWSVNCLAFAPDGRTLLAVLTDVFGAPEPRADLHRLNADTGEAQSVRSLPPEMVAARGLEVSADGLRLALGSGWPHQGSVWLGRPSGEWPAPLTHPEPVNRFRFDPDGRLLAVAAGQRTAVWEVASQRQLFLLRRHFGPVADLAFSPDSRTLATAGQDRRVTFWDIGTGRERRTFAWKVGPLGAVAFSPDGLAAACGGDWGQVVVWDLDGG
jgi:WD40 repeat protein